MIHLKRTKILKFTMMIALAVIMVSCVLIAVGTNMIMDAEQNTTAKQTEQLTTKRMKCYDRQTDIDAYAMSWINDRNKSSIVSIINEKKDGLPLLELYIDFETVDLDQPLSSIATRLNMALEYSVETNMIEFCETHHIDYHQTPIAEIDCELFLDLMDYLRKERGWSYDADFDR